MSCAVHHRADCGCPDPIFAGIVPAPDYAHPPARNGADAPPSIGPDPFPNHHEPRRSMRAFLRAKPFTKFRNTLFQKGISA